MDGINDEVTIVTIISNNNMVGKILSSITFSRFHVSASYIALYGAFASDQGDHVFDKKLRVDYAK